MSVGLGAGVFVGNDIGTDLGTDVGVGKIEADDGGNSVTVTPAGERVVFARASRSANVMPLRARMSDSVWPSISRMRGRIRALGGADEPLEQGLTDMVDGCLALSGAVALDVLVDFTRDLWTHIPEDIR